MKNSPPPTKFKEIFLVPHAHLDLSWLGTPAECEKINNGIIAAALDLLDAQPRFRYTIEVARPLERFLAENPGEKERVEFYFSEGRLEVGGMYVDVACDYCFDESLARNLLIGQKWLEKTFGALSDIAREEDVSSHFAQMPQLLAKSGFSYLKLSRGPAGVFRWAAPDGSEVVTALFEYNHSYHFRLGRSPELTRRNLPGYLAWMETQIKQPLPALMIMDGDDCTPPNPRLTEIAEAWNARTGKPPIKIATARDYLEAIPRDGLPSRRGDMPSFWGGVLLYELEAAAKLHEAERLITAAEKFAACRFLAGGAAQPPAAANLEETWKLLLTAQDHNWGGKDETKNGARADADKVEMIDSAIAASKDALESAMKSISQEIRPARPGTPLAVFNPLPWERDDVAVFTIPDDLNHENIKIVDSEGAETPVQLLPDNGKNKKAFFIAEGTPSVGYKTYYIEEKQVQAPPKNGVASPCFSIENDHYRIELNGRKNGVKSIFDKALLLDVAGMNRRSWLSAIGIDLPFPAPVAVGARFTTPPQEYYENPENLKKGGTGEGVKFLWKAWRPSQFKPKKITRTKGRVADTLRIEGSFIKSAMIQEFTLYDKIKRVDIRTTIDWKGEPEVFLAMLFPFPFRREETHVGTPFFVHRMGDEAEGFGKMPGFPIQPKIRGVQHWFCVSDRRRTVTISSPWRMWDFTLMPAVLLMASDDKGGFFRGERYLQKGRREWTFSLFSNAGDWKAGECYRRGVEPLNPLLAVAGESEKSGAADLEMSFCRVSPGNVVLTCLKGADAGRTADVGSVFARFYEAEGKAADVELEFPKKVSKAVATDMLEREGKALEVRGDKVFCKLAPYEIGNLKVFF